MSSAAPPLSAALRRWRNAVLAVFFLNGFGLAAWLARVPAAADDLGVDTATLGRLLIGLSIGSIVGLPLAPRLLARVGSRNGMAIAVCTIAAGLAITGIGTSVVGVIPLVFAGLIVLGLGIGSCDVLMNLSGALAEREIGRTVLPLMHSFFSLGTFAGAGLGAALVSAGLPVAPHLLGVAVLLAAGAVIATRFLPANEPAAAAPREPRPLGARVRESLAVWSDRRLILIGVILLGMGFAEGSASDWIAYATVHGHRLAESTGAILLAVFSAAMTIGRMLGGPLLDRAGRVPVLRATAALGILGVLCFVLGGAGGPALLALGAACWGLGASLGFPVGMSAAADDPQHAAARVTAVAMIGYLAFLAGPPALGALGQGLGILVALLLVPLLLLAAGLAAPAARERSAPASVPHPREA